MAKDTFFKAIYDSSLLQCDGFWELYLGHTNYEKWNESSIRATI